MDTGINITLNADLYRAAKSIEDGCDPDYIDDLCKEIAEFIIKTMILSRIK